MTAYVVTPQANADLLQIWTYIAKDNEATADRVQAEFFEMFESLALHPGQGHRRGDYTGSAVLFFPMYSYLIAYRQGTDPLQILAIIHGAREVKRILQGRGL